MRLPFFLCIGNGSGTLGEESDRVQNNEHQHVRSGAHIHFPSMSPVVTPPHMQSITWMPQRNRRSLRSLHSDYVIHSFFRHMLGSRPTRGETRVRLPTINNRRNASSIDPSVLSALTTTTGGGSSFGSPHPPVGSPNQLSVRRSFRRYKHHIVGLRVNPLLHRRLRPIPPMHPCTHSSRRRRDPLAAESSTSPESPSMATLVRRHTARSTIPMQEVTTPSGPNPDDFTVTIEPAEEEGVYA